MEHNLPPERLKIINPADPESVYALVDEIASGAFGTVYRATHLETKENVALKICPIEENSTLEELLVEVEILLKCQHPNIVRCYGAHLRGTELFIGMDLCGGGCITDIFQYEQVGLDEPLIAYLLHGTLQGLNYLHSVGIVHRDLKGENILLTNDGHVKLVDFGVSKDTSKGEAAKTFIGTPYYMPPEVIACKAAPSTYNEKSDIWAIGIVAIELAECQPPLYSQQPMRALLTITRSAPPTLAQPTKWSENFKDFLTQCLRKDPTERLSCINLLKHPFLQNPADSSEAVKLIKRKEQLKREEEEENEDDDDEPIEFDESIPGEEEEDEEDARWIKKATQLPGAMADLELLDDDDMDTWLQAGTLKKKPEEPQQTEPKLAEPKTQPAPQPQPQSQPQPQPQPQPTQTQPQQPQQSQSEPPSPRSQQTQQTQQSPRGQPQQSPRGQPQQPEPQSPRGKAQPAETNQSPREGTTRTTSQSFLSKISKPLSVSDINLTGALSFRGKQKIATELNTSTTSLPPMNKGGTIRKLKRQASVVQLQKEKRRVDDHRHFLQLAKALGNLVEQHKQQQQRLIKQQHKELEAYVQSLRETAKKQTIDHSWADREADQLSKQQIQITRKLQEKHKGELSHLRTQQQAKFLISRNSMDNLLPLFDMELKAMQEEHVLQMKHMIESSNLEIDQAEQRHAQQVVHQARINKQQLDRIIQLANTDEERVKQKYAKMQTHLEKLFQLERDQQIEMQKAELLEQNRQALLELKQWQKDKLQEHKKMKNHIKVQKTSKEAKAKELANFKTKIEEEAKKFQEEWQQKKEEDSELLKELHILQQETLKDNQENRKADLQNKLAAEIKNTKQKQSHMQVQQCIAKIELLENQAEQIRKLKYICLENQREVFYRSQASELQLLSKHSAELKSPSPRLESVLAEHKQQHHHFIALMEPGSEALAAPPHYDSQIAELKVELETLKEQLSQFPSSAQTANMTLSESGQYYQSSQPTARTSTSLPTVGATSVAPPSVASSVSVPSSKGLAISGITETRRGTVSTPAAPPPPPAKAAALPSANVRSDILAAIENFSTSKNLKKTVTKDKGTTGFKVQGLLTSITGFTKSKLKQTVTVDKSKPITKEETSA
eukprot:TRINITY_DN33_c0_g1_i1.p1 TRINITY_DN33_c0_g1~~TRINITY_DN33_c0_g1_i1.p1  ORF type:complete len:1122 (+),score=336.99 TRINITY_DN33_c0_g1_i1:64-3429(+)